MEKTVVQKYINTVGELKEVLSVFVPGVMLIDLVQVSVAVRNGRLAVGIEPQGITIPASAKPGDKNGV